MQPFLFVLGIMTLAAVAVFLSIARRRETRALRELAGRQRLNYTAEDLIDLHERYYRLHLIRQGHNRFAWNLLYGTTNEGLVSLFCYRYDLGFGVDQTHRSWWVAVLETPCCHSNWLADRCSEQQPHGGPGPAGQTPLLTKEGTGEVQPQARYEGRIGSFILRPDRHDTIDRLRQAGLEGFLGEATGVAHIEVCGHLVSLAAPHERNPQLPATLLEAVRHLARLLNDAVPAPSDPSSARLITL